MMQFFSTLIGKVDYFEQFFLVLYYIYENLILGSRIKLPGFDAERDAYMTNLTWFLSDLPLLVSSVLRLHENLREIRETKENIKVLKENLSLISKNEYDLEFNTGPLEALEKLWLTIVENIHSACTGTKLEAKYVTQSRGDHAFAELHELKLRMRRLLGDRKSRYLQAWIAVFEVGVSAHYSGFFKYIVESHGKFMGTNYEYNMSDGHVGLMGVLSSSLIMFQYWSHLPPDKLIDRLIEH